jgi:hypothetical protein
MAEISETEFSDSKRCFGDNGLRVKIKKLFIPFSRYPELSSGTEK